VGGGVFQPESGDSDGVLPYEFKQGAVPLDFAREHFLDRRLGQQLPSPKVKEPAWFTNGFAATTQENGKTNLAMLV
jgi:hypothetical protein